MRGLVINLVVILILPWKWCRSLESWIERAPKELLKLTVSVSDNSKTRCRQLNNVLCWIKISHLDDVLWTHVTALLLDVVCCLNFVSDYLQRPECGSTLGRVQLFLRCASKQTDFQRFFRRVLEPICEWPKWICRQNRWCWFSCWVCSFAHPVWSDWPWATRYPCCQRRWETSCPCLYVCSLLCHSVTTFNTVDFLLSPPYYLSRHLITSLPFSTAPRLLPLLAHRTSTHQHTDTSTRQPSTYVTSTIIREWRVCRVWGQAVSVGGENEVIKITGHSGHRGDVVSGYADSRRIEDRVEALMCWYFMNFVCWCVDLMVVLMCKLMLRSW